MKNRLDEDCWKPLPGRHISDMDVYMEFDDRWAHVGNQVSNNKYEQTIIKGINETYLKR